MRINFLQLERAFFDHAKTDFLIEKHGIQGAYCLLYIWSEMMFRDGAFDPSNELDVLGAAKRSRVSVDDVHSIIHTCLKVNLLMRHKKSGLLIKDRIDEVLDKLIGISEERSKAGKAGVEARRQKKLELAKSNHLLNQDESNSLGVVEANTKLLTNKLINELTNETTVGSSFIRGEASNGTAFPPIGGRQASEGWKGTPEQAWDKFAELAKINPKDETVKAGIEFFKKVIGHEDQDLIFKQIKIFREDPKKNIDQPHLTILRLKQAAWYVDPDLFPELGTGPEPKSYVQVRQDEIAAKKALEEQTKPEQP